MGLVKSAWIEAEERGWSAPDDVYACVECVEDEFLKEIVRTNVASKSCDYCGRKAQKPIAAPVEAILEPIGNTVRYYFNDPTDAGLPWDGGWVFDPTDTADVLLSLPLECNDKLFEVIEAAFTNDAWIPTWQGHWATSHPHESLKYSWNRFVHIVKHRIRYFFVTTVRTDQHDPDDRSPIRLLREIGRLTKRLKLIKALPKGVRLFRVREQIRSAIWDVAAEQMAAPPVEKASAGRMNPAGISYMYLAFELPTALAEVLNKPPCAAAIAEFATQRKLRLLDLTALPEMPSVFDGRRRTEREALMFLYDFVDEISRPVEKDGREHVEYVPSQVVCEFFAHAFRTSGNRHLDGLIYPSSIRSGGRNIVLFPVKDVLKGFDDVVTFQSGRAQSFDDWSDLAQAFQVPSA